MGRNKIESERSLLRDSTHPAGDVGDVGAAVELDVGAVLPDLRPQLDAVTAYAGTFSLSMSTELFQYARFCCFH